MICYLDRSFCSQPCANRECSRNFNDDVLARAKSWWGTENPPIDFDYLKAEDCGYKKIEK